MNKRGYKFAEIVLYSLFSIILLFSIVILIGAFFDHRSTNMEIQNFVIEKKLYTKDTLGHIILDPQLNSYLDKVEYKTDKLLEGNTVSFLFQIFTITLLTIGVHILDKSNRKHLELKTSTIELFTQIEKWEKLINANQLFLGISTILTEGVVNSYKLKLRPMNGPEYIPLIRESLDSVVKIISELSIDKVLIEKNYKDVIVRQISNIRNNIKNVEIGDKTLIEQNAIKISSFFTNKTYVTEIRLNDLTVSNKR